MRPTRSARAIPPLPPAVICTVHLAGLEEPSASGPVAWKDTAPGAEARANTEDSANAAVVVAFMGPVLLWMPAGLKSLSHALSP